MSNRFDEWFKKEEVKIATFIDTMKPEHRKEYYLRKGFFANDDKIKALEEKLKVAESCIKVALGRFDKGCHVLYLGDTYLKIKAYEEKYLEKIKDN